MDVGAAANGGQKSTPEIDTSDWFESQLPAAADQREAHIELTSIADQPMPTPPSIADATQEAREIGSGPGVVPPG